MGGNTTCAIGKFVYAAGAATSIHFMPLKEFHLDMSLDVSSIVAMRTSRISGNNDLIGSSHLAEWFKRTAAGPVVEAFSDLMPIYRGDEPLVVAEYFAGRGVVFESIKSKFATGERPRMRQYVAGGADRFRSIFETMHSSDVVDFVYGSLDECLEANADMSVVNHYGGVRNSDPGVATLEGIIERLKKPSVVAVQVVVGDGHNVRKSIKGDDVALPYWDVLRKMILDVDPNAQYRFWPGHDDAFFLPDAEAAGTALALVGLPFAKRPIRRAKMLREA